MSIIINLDVMMARRKISLGELAAKVEITPANLSILKTGKAKAIRFSTLESICSQLNCQPADLIEYCPDQQPTSEESRTADSSTLKKFILRDHIKD